MGAMKPLTITVGTITYAEFPSYEEILLLPNNLINAFLYFLRKLGVYTYDTLMEAMSAKKQEDIDILFKRCHKPFIQVKSDKSSAQAYAEWQSMPLRGDTREHRISIREVLEMAKKRSKAYKDTCIEHEISLALIRARNSGKDPKESTKGKGEIIIDEAKINHILKDCNLEVNRDWTEVRKNPEYLTELLCVHFPNVEYKVMKEYLFGESVGAPSTIGSHCSVHRIPTSTRKLARSNLEEHIAFIMWAGGNPEEFIKANNSKLWSGIGR